MTTEAEGAVAVVVLGSLLVVVGLGVARATSPGHAIREIEQTDPISRLHWKRTPDPHHPAAPPRLTPMPDAATLANDQAKTSSVCVRAGDRVLLQSGNTTSSIVSLDATALTSGSAGDRVRARVAVTGATVEITVTGPGEGVLLGKIGGWR